jgi:hypothetical protein
MWRIARGLFLGDCRDAHDRDLLLGLGITHVLNCAAEMPCWYRRDFRYYHLKLTDPDPEFHEYIDKACRFIHRGRKAGGVLVHCRAGLSRSPSTILAYQILRKRVRESDEGFIEPDPSFLEQIEVHFEDR